MAEHTVRLARTPNEEVTVGDAEYTDLQRMGLLAGEEGPQRPESGGQSTTPAAPKPSRASKPEKEEE